MTAGYRCCCCRLLTGSQDEDDDLSDNTVVKYCRVSMHLHVRPHVDRSHVAGCHVRRWLWWVDPIGCARDTVAILPACRS